MIMEIFKILDNINNNIEHEITILKSIGVSAFDLSDVYVLYDKDTLVGFSQHLKLGIYLEIDNLHILKDYREKGYGRKYVELLKEGYRDRIQYITGQSLPQSVGFWENIGMSFEEDITEDKIIEAEELGHCFSFCLSLG